MTQFLFCTTKLPNFAFLSDVKSEVLRCIKSDSRLIGDAFPGCVSTIVLFHAFVVDVM